MHNILRLGGAKKKIENRTIQDTGPPVIVNRTFHSADIKNKHLFFVILYGILAAWKCKKALNSVQCWGMFIFR